MTTEDGGPFKPAFGLSGECPRRGLWPRDALTLVRGSEGFSQNCLTQAKDKIELGHPPYIDWRSVSGAGYPIIPQHRDNLALVVKCVGYGLQQDKGGTAKFASPIHRTFGQGRVESALPSDLGHRLVSLFVFAL